MAISIYGIKTINEQPQARIELYLFGDRTQHQFSVDEIIDLLMEFQKREKEFKERWGEGMDGIRKFINEEVENRFLI